MLLGVIIPVPGLDQEGIRRRQTIYQECASANTEVVVMPTEGGPESTDSRYEEALAGPHIISTAQKLATRGLSAMIVSCFGDPCVGALREIFDFPVIGPGEASVLTASMLADKFSIVTILDNGIPMIEELVRTIGLRDRLVSVRAINIEPEKLIQNLERTRTATLEQAKRAVQDDNASAVIVGCSSPEMASIADNLKESLPVPVVNPVRAAVAVAESLTKQKLQNSRVTYRQPLSRVRSVT